MARGGRLVRNAHRRRYRLRDANIRRLLQNLDESRITISEFLVVVSNYFDPIRDEDEEIKINQGEINENFDAIRVAFARTIDPIVPTVAPTAVPDGVIIVAAAPVVAVLAGAIAPAVAPVRVVAAALFGIVAGAIAPAGVVAAAVALFLDVATAVAPVGDVAVAVASAGSVARLAPFDAVRIAVNPPQWGRPRSRPRIIGLNR